MAVTNPYQNQSYTNQSIVGYNASPPPDDGFKTPANQLAWSKHKDKLGDPLKTFAENINDAMATFGAAIDAAVATAFDAMVVTTDPAEETMVIAMQEFAR